MLQASFFKNKRVTVFGLGLNMGGVGTVRFLAEQGVREIIVTDIKSRAELGTSLEKLSKYKNITYILGQHRPEDFTRVDMVIKNPVIPWTNEYVKLAEKSGVPVEMDASIFFALCKAPIIGVTGSKGKTTTTTLLAHILENAGKRVVCAGIGQVGVLGMLGKVSAESVVVFELSSWRLSVLAHIKKSPPLAVLTNIYPDHLNYYKTMEAYIADKKNIFLFQKQTDTVIANFDDMEIRNMVQDAKGGIIWFSKDHEIEGDGVWMRDDALLMRKQGEKKVLMPIGGIALRGEHNISNVLAAAAAALAYGLSPKQIASGIQSFTGLPYRLERVGEKNGVAYYNDTAATIPEAAIAALRSFAEPVILIAGGSDKRLTFDALAQEILRRSKGLILFKGEATEKLIQALKAHLPVENQERSFEVVESMAKAVELASRGAVAGDVVLLSPGAASFGIFKNEFDRGDQFRQAVEALPASR
ncbi:MAG: UDP-N-acetylmuramoylalanine--D-glutamate ligase [Candidatus Moranbacteria bacterium RIFCSPHIGHO2_01_FULL_54_31]|nr:MAG: UDP-N-acetylmuramoylalanine--D-glutamate ligase [Candidatus Moranbacteria bacterium RIFCSPHIGHO2_01_FULL_54_31]